MNNTFDEVNDLPSSKIRNKRPHILILLILISFQAVGAVIFTSALPDMADDFDLSTPLAQLVISVYLLGAAVGQLFYGPLSNRFGRKASVYFGIVLSMVGALVTILASFLHFYSLIIIGRFLTAFGASVGMVMNFTLVKDAYEHDQARRVISYILMLSSIIPGISVAIGGFLVDTFCWQSTLYFLFLYSAGVLTICRYLPETCVTYDKDALKVYKIALNYRKQFGDFKLILGALFMGGNTLLTYIFSATSPFIIIKFMNFSPEQYGKLMLLPSLGLLLGSLLSSGLTEVLRTTQAIFLGLFLMLVSALFMFISFVCFHPTVWFIFTSMFFIYMSIAICYSNASALTLSNVSDASNGSAVISFINASISMLGVLCVQIFQFSGIMQIPIIFLSIIGVMCMLYLVWIYKVKITVPAYT